MNLISADWKNEYNSTYEIAKYSRKRLDKLVT